VSTPFGFPEATVYLFMASQLEIQFQELNNVLERKGTDGGAELENSVIYIPNKRSK
jgi:hypothetical protein